MPELPLRGNPGEVDYVESEPVTAAEIARLPEPVRSQIIAQLDEPSKRAVREWIDRG